MEWELQPGRDERLAGNLATSLLKTLALLFMLIDHLGVALFGNLLEMRVLGRIALPLYAWCLVVGNVKTRHPLRYFGRLLLLAAISQPLYMMALNHTWQHLNILFLLALATAAIQGIRLHRYGEQPLAVHPPDRFPEGRESIGQNIVYGFAFVQPFFQNGGLPLQLLIGKAFVFVFQSQNAVRDLLQPPYLRVVALSQQLFEKIFHCHAG